MENSILSKGFEVELFTGTIDSHIGISDEIENLFAEFVKEPDKRNVEYITEPLKDYKSIYQSLIKPRIKLREWLKTRNLTIIPSSTLCFKHNNQFERSDIDNTYHDFIENNYGISIATSSVHINLGINNLRKLFAAIRLARCEASIYLSLSASSPFLNGKLTGNHSQRWIQFPRTPAEVPFFLDHVHYVNWIKTNLRNGNMQNIRHFWSSIRPNGPKRPYQLDRLELRVCDFISDINLLLAVTALLELRIINLFENIDDLDPLVASKYSMKELESICDINELKAAKNSLNSELIHWRDGRTIICKEWINDLFDDISPIAKKMDISDVIEPIQKVLFEGNKSMKWISEFNKGSSIEEIMKYEIDTMIKAEELYI